MIIRMKTDRKIKGNMRIFITLNMNMQTEGKTPISSSIKSRM